MSQGAMGCHIEQAISEAAKGAAKVLADALRADRFRMLIDHASLRDGFEIRLRDPWGDALDALYTLHVVAVESAERHFKFTSKVALADRDEVWGAVLRIHARACQVASEIMALLRAGHAEGALARWRTLHELTVIASFLREQGDNELALRYLEHEAISSWWDAQVYQQHAERLQERPFSAAQMDAMGRERDRLLAQYGPAYDQPWGWLAGVIPHPSFAQLEKKVEFDHWRPLYRDATGAVHGGPKRLSYRLGIENAMKVWLTGPSNGGLQQPGIYAAISLSIVTTTMLTHRLNMDSLITARVVMELSEDAVAAFRRAEVVLDERIAEDKREEARRAKRRKRDRERRRAAASRATVHPRRR